MLTHSLLVHFSWGKVITTANDRHSVCMTSPVVIIVRTLKYRVCVNIKVRNNNIHECAPFAKCANIIDCETLQHTVYVYGMDMCDEAKLMHCVVCIGNTNQWA